jgi:hypothetical protein
VTNDAGDLGVDELWAMVGPIFGSAGRLLIISNLIVFRRLDLPFRWLRRPRMHAVFVVLAEVRDAAVSDPAWPILTTTSSAAAAAGAQPWAAKPSWVLLPQPYGASRRRETVRRAYAHYSSIFSLKVVGQMGNR